MSRTRTWRTEKRDHRWSRRHVHDYLDGELDTAQRARLERHARLCPECGPMLRSFVRLLRLLPLLRLAPLSSVAPGVLAHLIAENGHHEHTPSRR